MQILTEFLCKWHSCKWGFALILVWLSVSSATADVLQIWTQPADFAFLPYKKEEGLCVIPVLIYWQHWSASIKVQALFTKQRLVCGTDRGHLALLCQFLQLVGFVLCFYESLLHIIQRLERQEEGERGLGGWMQGQCNVKRYNTVYLWGTHRKIHSGLFLTQTKNELIVEYFSDYLSVTKKQLHKSDLINGILLFIWYHEAHICN